MRNYAATASGSPSGLARFQRTDDQKEIPMRTAPMTPVMTSGICWHVLMYMIAAKAMIAYNAPCSRLRYSDSVPCFTGKIVNERRTDERRVGKKRVSTDKY